MEITALIVAGIVIILLSLASWNHTRNVRKCLETIQTILGDIRNAQSVYPKVKKDE